MLRIVAHIRTRHLPQKQRPRWHARGVASYNQQPDAVSCGYYVCLFVELYLAQGRPASIFVGEPFLDIYRDRVAGMIDVLGQRQLPSYDRSTLPELLGGYATQASLRTSGTDTHINKNTHLICTLQERTHLRICQQAAS